MIQSCNITGFTLIQCLSCINESDVKAIRMNLPHIQGCIFFQTLLELSFTVSLFQDKAVTHQRRENSYQKVSTMPKENNLSQNIGLVELDIECQQEMYTMSQNEITK